MLSAFWSEALAPPPKKLMGSSKMDAHFSNLLVGQIFLPILYGGPMAPQDSLSPFREFFRTRRPAQIVIAIKRFVRNTFALYGGGHGASDR